MPNRINTSIDPELEKVLRDQMNKLMEDLECLGIPRRKVSKVKASKLLAKKINENRKNLIGLF